jgi:catechol-2,3-dioxygenase
VVGLRVGPRPAQRRFGYGLYAGEVAVVHLSEADPDGQRALPARGTFTPAAFRGQGLQPQQAILRRHGIAVRVVDDPQQRQLFFSDPAGNGVELACVRDDNA